MASGKMGGGSIPSVGAKGGGGGMPPTAPGGGANTGTFHGNHNVAHPIQGGSGSQSISKSGKTGGV